jgi:hypothetical protein
MTRVQKLEAALLRIAEEPDRPGEGRHRVEGVEGMMSYAGPGLYRHYKGGHYRCSAWRVHETRVRNLIYHYDVGMTSRMKGATSWPAR